MSSSTAVAVEKTTEYYYDVIIIGGSYSGLQAALTLGRSLRKVLVIDGGKPCNRYTPHSQNFLTHDGSKPSDIAELGKQQIQDTYGSTVTFLDNDLVIGGSTSSNDDDPYKFKIKTQNSKQQTLFKSKYIIVASGVVDQIPPNISGFEECWGTSIIHCPYCHGYEYRGKRTGLYLTQSKHITMSFSHLLPLLKNLTNEIYLILDSGDHGDSGDGKGQDNKLSLSKEQLDKVSKHGINVIDVGSLKSIQHDSNGYMSSITLEGRGGGGDGGKNNKKTTIIELDAMYTMLDTKQSCTIPHDIFGCDYQPQEEEHGNDNDDKDNKTDDNGNGLLKVNGMYQTNIDNIYAVGDTITPFRTVANAVSSGNMAGAIINMQLSQSEF